MLRRLHDRRFFPALLIALYLMIAAVSPSHWSVVLLGYAVVRAARAWTTGGLVLASAASGGAMLFWLLWHGGAELLNRPTQLLGYFWAWVALTVLGVHVATLSNRTRQVVQVNEELRNAQQRLAALHAVAVSLSGTLDVNRLIGNILDHLGKQWAYEHGSVLLLDELTGELVVADARGYEFGPGTRFPSDKGITGAVLQGGRPICVGDLRSDSRYVPGLEGACSELAVPLVWEGAVIGVLNVESRNPDAFGTDDITLLCTVADHAAAALGNARLHQQARHLALTDPHTGLYNYRHYQEQINEMLREAQLTGHPCSVLMLDLDHFKRINDTFGHPTGDAVLQQVANLLQASCRQGDLCYRYGGEEFSVTLPGAPNQVAVRVAERIRKQVARHRFTTKSDRPLDVPVTVSIGVATYPDHGLTVVDLMLAADRSLYAAKDSGRNRVVSGPPGAEVQPT